MLDYKNHVISPENTILNRSHSNTTREELKSIPYLGPKEYYNVLSNIISGILNENYDLVMETFEEIAEISGDFQEESLITDESLFFQIISCFDERYSFIPMKTIEYFWRFLVCYFPCDAIKSKNIIFHLITKNFIYSNAAIQNLMLYFILYNIEEQVLLADFPINQYIKILSKSNLEEAIVLYNKFIIKTKEETVIPFKIHELMKFSKIYENIRFYIFNIINIGWKRSHNKFQYGNDVYRCGLHIYINKFINYLEHKTQSVLLNIIVRIIYYFPISEIQTVLEANTLHFLFSHFTSSFHVKGIYLLLMQFQELIDEELFEDFDVDTLYAICRKNEKYIDIFDSIKSVYNNLRI